MPRTVEEINENNRRFWKAQAWLMHKRLGEPAIAAAAYALIQDDAKRVPVAHRRNYETASRDAAVAVRAAAAMIRSAGARKAGSAKKGDLLAKLMRKIYAERPNISEPELLVYLRKREGHDGIAEVSDTTIFMEREISRRKAGGDKLKGRKTEYIEISISGLKDRLSRIKGKLPPR